MKAAHSQSCCDIIKIAMRAIVAMYSQKLGGVQADVAETVGPGDVDVADRAARQAVVEDAQVGQDVQRGAVDDQGSIVVARLVVGAAVYRLDDRHVESGAGQADGQRCAGHPAAGDDDVVLVFGVHDC